MNPRGRHRFGTCRKRWMYRVRSIALGKARHKSMRSASRFSRRLVAIRPDADKRERRELSVSDLSVPRPLNSKSQTGRRGAGGRLRRP